MFRALVVPKEQSLASFSRLLWQQRIPHQVIQQANEQWVLVARVEQLQETLELHRRWDLGEIVPEQKDPWQFSWLWFGNGARKNFRSALIQSPFTLFIITACLLSYWLAPLQSANSIVLAMLFPDLAHGSGQIDAAEVLQGLNPALILRMLTPSLLHGGILHLVFNMLWFWELGKRIELRQSSLSFALLTAMLGLLSNSAQYLYGETIYFGGMSGVVYGLFAYIWMWRSLAPRAGITIPRSLIGFMLISLILMTVLNLSMIANEAHLAGFIAGMAMGAVSALRYRISLNDK